MPDQTPNLALPWLMPAQAQKHVTMNEALGRLDALVHLSVESRSTAQQPTSPVEGQGYLMPASPTGDAWQTFDAHSLAYFQDGAWHGVPARAGLVAHVRDEGTLVVCDGAGWVGITTLITALCNLTALGIGTEPDANNPFAAKLNAALWTALTTGEGGTGDLRFTMNMEGASDTASILFQSGWSGRAEMGLTGSEDFTIKVSPDGSSWTDALVLDRSTGAVRVEELGIGTASPQTSLHIETATPSIRLKDSDTGAFSQFNGSSTSGGLTIQVDQSAVGSNPFLRFDIGGVERARIDDDGRLGIAVAFPTAALDIDGDTWRLRQSKTPASSNASGDTGEVCWDADYLYVCVASNSWKRTALATW